VTEADITHAEASYSEDALVDIILEMKDVKPDYADVPYGFISAPAILSRVQVEERLREVRVPDEDLESVIQLLLWFGFLGIYVNEDDERYSYLFEHNVKRMQSGLPTFAYSVHPAFRASLGIHP
jgi:hypothetical protein